MAHPPDSEALLQLAGAAAQESGDGGGRGAVEQLTHLLHHRLPVTEHPLQLQLQVSLCGREGRERETRPAAAHAYRSEPCLGVWLPGSQPDWSRGLKNLAFQEDKQAAWERHSPCKS